MKSATNQQSEKREDIYQDLHGGQLAAQEAANAASAECVLDIVTEYFQPASVLDVGSRSRHMAQGGAGTRYR